MGEFTKELNFKNTFDKVYFIHIPKTSGGSVKRASKGSICLSRAHVPGSVGAHQFFVDFAYRVPRSHGGFFRRPRFPMLGIPPKNSITISIVRNPFDMLCSYYFHGVNLHPNAKFCHSGWAAVNYTHQFKSFEDFAVICLMGLSGGTGTLLLIYGSRKAELSKIMPFDYIEIFFALILGWIFFKEWPVDQLFPGALFIVAGGIIIYLRQTNFIKTRERKA